MDRINLEGINPTVSSRFSPFINEIIKGRGEEIHSIYIVGSAVTPDFNEKRSDINSVIILHRMSLDFLEFIAPFGKKYSKKRVSAPLVMTIEHINNSLDVFPIEFHDFRLIHKTVYGEDILKDLEIKREHLRLQCERDIKTRLIGLRQGYISSAGDRKLITEVLIRSFTGTIPLFRAIIYLMGKEPPILRKDVIKTIQGNFSDSDVFERLLFLRNGIIKPSGHELSIIFKDYYNAIERIAERLDELKD